MGEQLTIKLKPNQKIIIQKPSSYKEITKNQKYKVTISETTYAQLMCEDNYNVNNKENTVEELGEKYPNLFLSCISNSAGDPHIDPLFGKSYELPLEPNNYRMLEAESLYFNVETRKVTTNERQQIHKFYTKVTGNTDYNNVLTNGCFFKTLFIYSEGKKLIIDLSKRIYNINDDKYFKFQRKNIKFLTKGTYKKNKIKESFEIAFYNTRYGSLKLFIYYFENPQIHNGYSLHYQYDSSMHGLLIREYDIDNYTLNNVQSDSNIKNKNVKINKAYSEFKIVHQK